ncbi:MAG: two-component system response regulator NarL [Gammaproteobacteria bacterium]|nr:two-component system response regulator NarL [Gammaproteobacteria bacterium]
MTTVLLIDDHPLLRNGVRQLLSLEPRFRVVGEAGTGDEGLALARSLEPDLILLDLNMKDDDGISVLHELRRHGIRGRVVILSVSDDPRDLHSALHAGADGYLLKDMAPEQLLALLRGAAIGQRVFSPSLLPHLEQAPNDERQQKLAQLTSREQQILAQIARGRSNRDIGEALHIAEGTVKVHVKSLLRKLDLKSRTEAAVFFLG